MTISALAAEFSTWLFDSPFPSVVCDDDSFSIAIEDDRDKSDNSSIAFCFFRTFQCRHSAKEANQSEIWSWAQMDGTGYIDVVTCRLDKKIYNNRLIKAVSLPLGNTSAQTCNQFYLPIAVYQFLSVPSIERYPCCVATIGWNGYLKGSL